MNRKIPSFLLDNEPKPARPSEKKGKLKLTFLDRTIKGSAGVIRDSILQYENSRKASGFQRLSSQSVLILFLFFIVCISFTHNLTGQILFTSLIFIFVLTTSISLKTIYLKAFILSFLFGFLVMLPACLNVFAPGDVIVELIRFPSNRQFWIYHMPEVIGITKEGIIMVTRMFLKVFNSVSLTFLVIYSVSFSRLMKSLRLMKVPSIFILILTMSYKFIYTMTLAVEEMFLAMRSRWIGNFDQSKTRQLIAGRMGFLFRKSFQRYEEVYRAMISRGFTGEILIKTHEKVSWTETCLLIFLLGISLTISILKF